MTNISAVFLKEIRAYFESPMAYVFIILFLLFSGAYFTGTLFLENVSSLAAFFEIAPVLFLLFVPAVTMRLISEEKRMGTYEILFTKPVYSGEIIIGKFLAAWLLVVSSLIPSLVYAGTVVALGSVDGGQLLGGYIGLVLLGGAFVAAGTFTSTLSDNQIISLIVGVVITAALFLFDKILIYIPYGLVSVIEYLGIGHHFSGLARGVVDSRDVVYFLSLIVFFLLLASIVLEREVGELGWKGKRWNEGPIKIVAGCCFLILLNLISMGSFARIDLTRNSVYTLSDATKRLLSSLDDYVFVKAYFTSDLPPPYHNHRKAIQELLEEYRAYSHGKLNYQFINPRNDSAVEEEALRDGLTPVQMKVIKNDRFQTEKGYLGIVMTYGDRRAIVPAVPSIDRLEYDLTSNIKHLTESRVVTVAFLTGHGEPGLQEVTSLKQALLREYAVTTCSLSTREPIPEDVAAVLVVAPDKRFEDREKFVLDQYIMRGGRVAFFINAVGLRPTERAVYPQDLNLDDMFEAYGWSISRDLVADSRCGTLAVNNGAGNAAAQTEIPYPFYPLVSDFDKANIVVSGLPPITFPYVSSIETQLGGTRGVTATILLTSSTSAKRLSGEKIGVDPSQIPTADGFGDRNIPLAATFEGSFKSLYAKRRDSEAFTGFGKLVSNMRNVSKPTRIAVVGDGDFVKDGSPSLASNTALASNLVGWLVDDTGLASIRARDLTPKPLDEVSENVKSASKAANLAAPPIIVIAVGLIFLALKRMRQRYHKNSF